MTNKQRAASLVADVVVEIWRRTMRWVFTNLFEIVQRLPVLADLSVSVTEQPGDGSNDTAEVTWTVPADAANYEVILQKQAALPDGSGFSNVGEPIRVPASAGQWSGVVGIGRFRFGAVLVANGQTDIPTIPGN